LSSSPLSPLYSYCLTSAPMEQI